MTLLTTEAIILSAFHYGETSKIVRLATREFGVQSAIAKGALRPRSRFGAALQPLSRGQAQLIPARSSDLHLLTAFDLLHLPVTLAGAMERYSAAQVLAELVQRFAPADSHPALYQELADALDRLERCSPAEASPVGLAALWRIVALLGFQPSLDQCVLDGTAIAADAAISFSVQEGGALCPRCAASHSATRLAPADVAGLAALLTPGAAPPDLDAAHLTAHRRLLARFIHHQLGEGAALPALEFWQRRGWEPAR